MLISIIYLSASKNNPKLLSNIMPVNIKPTKTILPAGSINPQKASPAVTSAYRQTSIVINQSPATIPSGKPTDISPAAKTTTVPNTSAVSSQIQPTTRANPTVYSTPAGNPTGTTSSSSQIVFINSDGEPEAYTPPDTAPVEIIWARYTNQLEHYAIDYPSNWQIVATKYRGHDAIFIYAPGEDPSDPDVQYISYGWSTYFYPPQASFISSFALDGVSGTIYTNGSIGSSFIAGVFNYANGFLILNNNISDEIFAYVFNHMILSLDFNTP